MGCRVLGFRIWVFVRVGRVSEFRRSGNPRTQSGATVHSCNLSGRSGAVVGRYNVKLPGFKVWGLGFGAQSLGFGVWGLGSRVWA